MKRFVSYIIDYIVLALGLALARDSLFRTVDNLNLLWFSYFFIIYFYFVLNDLLFQGSSIGKKIMNFKIILKKQSIFLFAILHSLIKIVFSFIWPISIMIFIVGKCHMPYDKYFYEYID